MANKDIFEGKWHEVKGTVRQKWGKLTDNDVTQIQGNYEKLCGLLQQRYGYAKDQAEKEIDTFLTQSSTRKAA